MIIPLYNAAKYIGECLDSLLAQTFMDFEVIVVDDCSTDSSPAIVESYAPKFDGRLTLLHMKKNSGSGTEPRNLGLNYARGEYLYFMDNDDAVTPTALEELYSLAKEYDADVVHCDKYYPVPDELWNNVEYIKNLKPACWPAGDKIFITEPTLLTEDLARRTVAFSKYWLTWSIWLQLIRRRFVLENNLRFVGVVLDDKIFTLCEICCAKKYLVVPNVIYMHRFRPDSLMEQDKKDVKKFVHSRLTMLKDGVRYLDDFLDNSESFSKRPDLKYILFDFFIPATAGHLNDIYAQVPAPALDVLLRKEFGGDNAALTSFIFNAMNIYRLQFMQAQQRIAALETEMKRLKS